MKFTIARSNNPISKKFELGQDGKLVKSDGGNLTLATFDTQGGHGMSSLYDYILSDACTDKVILIPGTTEFDSGLIVTKGEVKRREDEDVGRKLVARSKDFFSYRGGEGFILLDYDPSEDYTQNDGKALTKDELFSILNEVLPELKGAPMLWKTSSSSNISNEDGTSYRGVTGQHIFLAVKNTADIPRIVDIFYKRLWLMGHGYIFIDKTGRMHDRTIIDKVVNSPEREIFIKAECVSPVTQSMDIELFNDGRTPLNTEVITELTIEESMRVESLILSAKDKRKGLAESVTESYIDRMHAQLGMSKPKLRECINNHILFGDAHIKLSNGTEVTVHEIFKHPEKYDGEYCYDPLEPEYGGLTGGATKAWIDVSNKRIHGHAHGGIWYDLEFSDRKSPRELALEVVDCTDHNILFKTAASSAVKMRYIQTELDQLVDYIAKFANLKKGSCDKAFKKKYNALTSSGSVTGGGVDTELNSDALNQDGTIAEGMSQANLSIGISHKFPHTNTRGDNTYNLDTFENFEFMCKVYQLKFSYDVMLKSPDISFPNGEVCSGDNQANAGMSRIKSLCVLNGLGKDSVSYLIELINSNQLNPVLDWVKRAKWDGRSRLQLITDKMVVDSYGESDEEGDEHAHDDGESLITGNIEFSTKYKEMAVRMWMIQCIAALDGGESSPLSAKNGIAVPKYEHILVFVGGQGVQKTKFIKSLLPNELNKYILTGHELDVKDKDNIKIAISHWITELGELDSTFRKSDISSLKAFMSKENDQMRMPYAHTDSKFKRRTSFCGTVNDVGFLVDETGNRRYLPLEVQALEPLNMIEVPWFTESGKIVEYVEAGVEVKTKAETEIKTEVKSKVETESASESESEVDSAEPEKDIFGRVINVKSDVDHVGGESDGTGCQKTGGNSSKNGEISGNSSDNGGVGGNECHLGDENNSDIGGNSGVNTPNGMVAQLAKCESGMVIGGKPVPIGELSSVKLRKLGSAEETQQLWAEIYHYYIKGEQWWPSDELEVMLETVLGGHKRVDPAIEQLEAKFNIEFNDVWRVENRCRGEVGMTKCGKTLRFVTLNYTEIAHELCSVPSPAVINKISNFLRLNGINKKKYTMSGKGKKGVRVALRDGERLISDMGVNI